MFSHFPDMGAARHGVLNGIRGNIGKGDIRYSGNLVQKNFSIVAFSQHFFHISGGIIVE